MALRWSSVASKRHTLYLVFSALGPASFPSVRYSLCDNAGGGPDKAPLTRSLVSPAPDGTTRACLEGRFFGVLAGQPLPRTGTLRSSVFDVQDRNFITSVSVAKSSARY